MATFSFKLLVAGPFGVGKTTLIEQISSVPVVGTEVSTTGNEARRKATTTVGIEYGVYLLDEGDLQVELLLFGTPGQARFSAVREIAARGMDGLLLLVDGTDPSSWPEAADLYRSFAVGRTFPLVIAVNRLGDDDPTPAALLETLAAEPGAIIVHGQVTEADDARRFLIELLDLILAVESDDLPVGPEQLQRSPA